MSIDPTKRFPDELPIEELALVADAIATRSITAAAFPAWWIQGYAMGRVFPDGRLTPDRYGAMAVAPDLSDDELVETLRLAAQDGRFGAGDDPAKAIPWLSIAKAMAKLLLSLI